MAQRMIFRSAPRFVSRSTRGPAHSRLVASFAALAVMLAASDGGAQLSNVEQKCIKKANKASFRISALQGRDINRCVKLAFNERTPAGETADTCVSGDLWSKVSFAQAAVTLVRARRCAPAPPFGLGDQDEAINAPSDRRLDLLEDIIGDDLENTITHFADDARDAKCQFLALRRVDALANIMARVFGICARVELKLFTASPQTLETCLGRVPTQVKVAKLAGKLGQQFTAINGKCAGTNTDTLFPGRCVGSGDLVGCLRNLVDCRMCQILAAVDDISVDCDIHDNGQSDGSCPVVAP